MAALNPGTRAPDFTLPVVQGRQFSLDEALEKGPVVLAFFKVTCPVCQYTLPFLQRVYGANRSTNVTVLGVSQDNLRDTQEFLREYGVSFPVALDDHANYAVSNAYGLTNVPTIFYVEPNGEIRISSVGWSKPDMEAINQRVAQHSKQRPVPLWRKGEDIQDFRAG